jgi:rhodanese-related sulfurtransferase
MNLKHIEPKDFIELRDTKDLLIIDIREPHELLEIPFHGAINIPLNLLLTRFDKLLSKAEKYYIVCHHGQRSFLACQILSNNGYDVINVRGGVDLINRVRNQ